MIEKATVNDLDQIVDLKIRMFEDMGAKWLLAENAKPASSVKTHIVLINCFMISLSLVFVLLLLF